LLILLNFSKKCREIALELVQVLAFFARAEMGFMSDNLQRFGAAVEWGRVLRWSKNFWFRHGCVLPGFYCARKGGNYLQMEVGDLWGWGGVRLDGEISAVLPTGVLPVLFGARGGLLSTRQLHDPSLNFDSYPNDGIGFASHLIGGSARRNKCARLKA